MEFDCLLQQQCQVTYYQRQMLFKFSLLSVGVLALKEITFVIIGKPTTTSCEVFQRQQYRKKSRRLSDAIGCYDFHFRSLLWALKIVCAPFTYKKWYNMLWKKKKNIDVLTCCGMKKERATQHHCVCFFIFWLHHHDCSTVAEYSSSMLSDPIYSGKFCHLLLSAAILSKVSSAFSSLPFPLSFFS